MGAIILTADGLFFVPCNWIAQQVADTKYTHDVRPLFREAREIAGKKPDMLISDGAPNFHEAYQKEY